MQWDRSAGLPEDVALKLVALLLLVPGLQPHGFLLLLRLLTQTVHQPLLPQGLLLQVKHTDLSVRRRQQRLHLHCLFYYLFIYLFLTAKTWFVSIANTIVIGKL